MFYGLSNFANNWVAANRPEQIMYVFGKTSIFLSLLAIPVYIFGKEPLKLVESPRFVCHFEKIETKGPKLEVA